MKPKTNIYEQLEVAKDHEDAARQARIEIENKILEMLSDQIKPTGQTTLSNSGYKITIKKNQAYKIIDVDKYSAFVAMNPLYEIHRTKLEVDKKKFDAVCSLVEKSVYKKISDCIEIKDGKPTVTVEKE